MAWSVLDPGCCCNADVCSNGYSYATFFSDFTDFAGFNTNTGLTIDSGRGFCDSLFGEFRCGKFFNIASNPTDLTFTCDFELSAADDALLRMRYAGSVDGFWFMNGVKIRNGFTGSDLDTIGSPLTEGTLEVSIVDTGSGNCDVTFNVYDTSPAVVLTATVSTSWNSVFGIGPTSGVWCGKLFEITGQLDVGGVDVDCWIDNWELDWTL